MIRSLSMLTFAICIHFSSFAQEISAPPRAMEIFKNIKGDWTGTVEFYDSTQKKWTNFPVDVRAWLTTDGMNLIMDINYVVNGKPVETIESYFYDVVRHKMLFTSARNYGHVYTEFYLKGLEELVGKTEGSFTMTSAIDENNTFMLTRKTITIKPANFLIEEELQYPGSPGFAKSTRVVMKRK